MGCPLHKKRFLFLFLLPIAFLNFEQTTVGVSISIHSPTVVVNSNNFHTHPICNLLSTNEINPIENIFNKNVMQNGISKIVKSGRFNQFLLKSARLQSHYYNIHQYTPIQPGTEELLLSSRKVHPPVSQIWCEAGFCDRSDIHQYTPIQPGTEELLLSSRKVNPSVRADSRLKYFCTTPKFVDIQWFLVIQMNITN